MLRYSEELNKLFDDLISQGVYDTEKEFLIDYDNAVLNGLLTDRELYTHCFLRICKNYKEIAETFSKDFGEEVTTEAVRKNGVRAKQKIFSFFKEQNDNR